MQSFDCLLSMEYWCSCSYNIKMAIHVSCCVHGRPPFSDNFDTLKVKPFFSAIKVNSFSTFFMIQFHKELRMCHLLTKCFYYMYDKLKIWPTDIVRRIETSTSHANRCLQNHQYHHYCQNFGCICWFGVWVCWSTLASISGAFR